MVRRVIHFAPMDERRTAGLNLRRALQEHADAGEAFATEAAAIASGAEQEGKVALADALRELARHHGATAIQYQARRGAMAVDGPSDGRIPF